MSVLFVEKLDKMTIPAIPVQGFVAFPKLPLSYDLTNHALAAVISRAIEDNSYLFIITQKDSMIERPERADLYDVGVIAKIKQMIKLPGNEGFKILIEGLWRAELLDCRYNEDDILVCDVMKKEIEVEKNGGVKGEALIRRATELLDDYLEYASKIPVDIKFAAKSISSISLFCDFVTFNLYFKIEGKQKILDTFDPIKRMEVLVMLLEEELEFLEVENDIVSKVHARNNKLQREHFLREQMQLIQEELGQSDEFSDSDDLYEMLKKKSLPNDVRRKLEKEMSKLDKMPFGAAESTVIRNYVETCLELPWGVYTKDKLSVEKAAKILDRDHYGLEKVKERILEFLAVKQLSSELKGQILLLVGPPGVGKTSIASSIAKALGRSFVRASLGGVHDEADIRGHRKTYIGAMPGRIINALKLSGSMNPLFLLDELDKLTQSAHGDPASALLEVLDIEQNSTFRDHFIELPVDLSECIFVATANTTDTIPRPLLDRMEVIRIPSYTMNEKLMIAKNYLIPKQLKRHGLTKRELVLTDSAIVELIEGYTKESGVRQLEREIANVCRKTAKAIATKEKRSRTLEKKDILPLIGRHKVKPERLSENSKVGIVNGLAWTEVGGELLKMEAVSMDGSGKIEITGSLGDVMKESARIAVSLVRTMSRSLRLCDREFYKTKDIHIHAPEGAVPKDGPSAGITMTTAIVSELTGIPVRCDVAMTGEITLHGDVLAIGGLREKTMAAYAAGIKTIIIPHDNLEDLEEVDIAVKENVRFIPVKTISEVLQVALDFESGEEFVFPFDFTSDKKTVGNAVRV